MCNTTIKNSDIRSLIGEQITNFEYNIDDCALTIKTASGRTLIVDHSQSCCESVALYSVKGDVDTLFAQPVLDVDVSTDNNLPDDYPKDADCLESFTVTTYTFETENETVVVTWVGLSNGYYNEGVDTKEVFAK